MSDQPTFLYDFNSSYAYLASARVDTVLPEPPRWQPVAFGAMIVELGKVPWSLKPEREEKIRECEQRARDYGLPELRWPEGWPKDCYSLLPLRAALVAEEHGKLREFSHAAFRRFFADGVALGEIDTVVAVAEGVGLDGDAIRAGVQRPEIKQRLRDATAEVLAAGVTGVPTIVIGEQLFWGDDRLEDAAAALA